MRAGKKKQAETGKTRPCIVYVKNLKESETTDIINGNAAPYKPVKSKSERAVAAKVASTKRTQTDTELKGEKPRSTRTTRRATTIADVDRLSKHRENATSPIATRSQRNNVKGDTTTSTVTRATAKTTTAQQQQGKSKVLSKRRNTAVILAVASDTCTQLSKRRSEPPTKPKMYKQSKQMAPAVVTTPPPTIAASRSRRSIKPNPKYASEYMVTPKYVRTVKYLFADEDDDLPDLIDEDNDDELNDAAFNPQLHKSDDDDISENEFEQQLRYEKMPPKRGRGRPPKSASAVLSNTPPQTRSGLAQTGRNTGGASQLQQLRRTMNSASNLTRSHMKVMPVVSAVGNKRKLDNSSEGPIARKRMATETGGNSRSAPVINGSTSVAKSSSTIAMPKTKVLVGNNNSNSGLRMLQATAACKQRTASNFKAKSPTAATARSPGTVGRPPGSTNAHKMQKAAAERAAPAAVVIKSTETEDVPTFTIVNIDDIINQDDVLISRSASNNSSKKLSSAVRNNNGSNARTNQFRSSPPKSLASSTQSNNLATNKRLKAGTANTKPPLVNVVNHHITKQMPLVFAVSQPKPRPRILNAEMGKKTQPMMKPLMSMGNELCSLGDSGCTEDEDINNELAEDDIIISPSSQGTNSTGVVRRVQTANWIPNQRNVLSSTASMNAGNNQRQQQHHQPHQLKLRQQQHHLAAGSDRKLTKLLAESSDDDVFKKPASPSSSTPQQRRYKENAADAEDTAPVAAATAVSEPESKEPKYFPPETTTYYEEDGRLVKKITCYETWHVISTPKESSYKTRQQRTCLELPLVKLANVAAHIKMPSSKWTSKVTLYKLSPSLMQRQTMTIFTGDLKCYNIPEEERHKYQPSCVLFRRSVLDRSKCRVPFDRALIFKNKCFYANIDGKHVNLLGAPEVVNSVKDVELLIDIVDSLTLSSDLVEMVTSK